MKKSLERNRKLETLAYLKELLINYILHFDVDDERLLSDPLILSYRQVISDIENDLTDSE